MEVAMVLRSIGKVPCRHLAIASLAAMALAACGTTTTDSSRIQVSHGYGPGLAPARGAVPDHDNPYTQNRQAVEALEATYDPFTGAQNDVVFPGRANTRAEAAQRYADVRAEALDGDCGRRIEVGHGDTLQTIADYCDVSVSALARANPDLRHPHDLRAGDTLAVPVVTKRVAPVPTRVRVFESEVEVPIAAKRPVAPSHMPTVSISPFIGDRAIDVRVDATDLPAFTEGKVFIGRDVATLQPFESFVTDANGNASIMLRLDNRYKGDRAVIAVRTNDGRAAAVAPDELVLFEGPQQQVYRHIRPRTN
jgi:hypothetical protein